MARLSGKEYLKQQEQKATEVAASVEEKEDPLANLFSATRAMLPLFRKIDKKGLFSIDEYNKICMMVAGDKKRATYRLLLGLQQRSFVKADREEINRCRLLLTLFENEQLTDAALEQL